MKTARAAARAGRLSEAEHALREAAKLAPRDPRPHQALADVYHRTGYLDREIEEREAAVRLAPSDFNSAFRLTDIYLDLVWFKPARDRLMLAIRSAPDDPRVFIALATQAYMRFQPLPLERAANEGLRRAPTNDALKVLLSESYRLQGRLADAERVLRGVVQSGASAGQREAADVGLARLLLDDRWHPARARDAEKAARAALKLRHEDADAYYWLGVALEEQGRWKQAIPAYAFTARKNPRFESVAFRLGRLYLRLPDAAKHKEGARLLSLYRAKQAEDEKYRDARDTLQKHPDSADAHRGMAAAYARAGQKAEAVVELREALRLQPKDAAARRQLAGALRACGRAAEARAYDKP